MLYLLYSLNFLLMIALPIILGFVLWKKLGAPWGLFGIGCVTFIGSQVVHIPLNLGIQDVANALVPDKTPQPWMIPFNAVVLGLSAGICEETARYVGYRWLAPRARSVRDALMLGAGHGGIEAIILGLLAGLSFINLAVVRTMDLSTLGLTGEALKTAQALVTAYWNAPAYLSIMGFVERLFAVMAHLSLSVMVLQVFTRRNLGWLGAAILYHALLDAVVVFAAQSRWSVLAIEGAVAVVALGGLAVALLLWRREPPELAHPPEPAVELLPGASTAVVTAEQRARRVQEQIEGSRYA
jgi:uncharacterized membrane protein YhfC